MTPPKKKTILIIEDDADLRQALQIRLTANHYRVVAAADVPGGVLVARREMPDVILLDLGLPAGDGFMVIQRSSSSRRAIPSATNSAQWNWVPAHSCRNRWITIGSSRRSRLWSMSRERWSRPPRLNPGDRAA
jgi:DNA-binding NtrC family response regulator